MPVSLFVHHHVVVIDMMRLLKNSLDVVIAEFKYLELLWLFGELD